MAAEYGYSKIEDLYAALGYGKFSARQVLQKAGARRRSRTSRPEAARAGRRAAPAGSGAAAGRAMATRVIKVRGMDDLLVYRAKCCNPIRGEAIVGYVTRGKGVAVHSRMCPNVQNLMYDVERKIEVEWARTADDAFPVRIVVHTDDRPGMLNAAHLRALRREHQHPQPGSQDRDRPRRRHGGNDRGRARQEAARKAGGRHAAHLGRARRGAALQLNMSLSTDPEHIAISKSKGIKIDWKDGHHSEYGLDVPARQVPLRRPAPARTARRRAPSRSAPAIPFQMYKPTLKMLGVEPVGNYAIRINWSDGHNTGIYSYEHFREICPCEECKAGDDANTRKRRLRSRIAFVSFGFWLLTAAGS